MQNFDAILQTLLRIFGRDIDHYFCVIDPDVEDVKGDLLMSFNREIRTLLDSDLKGIETLKVCLHNIVKSSESFFRDRVPNGQRPTANGERPTANGQRPTANGQQPTANSQRPTANGERPTANGQRRTANSQRRTADSQQPIATSRQPTADSRQPTADSRQPTADSRQPIADSRQPTADSRQPTADSRQPLSHDRERQFTSRPDPGTPAAIDRDTQHAVDR